MRTTAAWMLASVALAMGCSNSSSNASGTSGNTSSSSSSGSGMPALTTEQTETVQRATSTLVSVQQAMVIADSVFRFDPDLNPSRNDLENAGAVRTRAADSIGGCGMLTLMGTTVTVDFGPPPGCALFTGARASGSLSAGITKTGPTVAVALTFSSLVVNGIDLAGGMSFSTQNAMNYAITFSNFASGGTSINGSLAVVGAPGQFTLDASLTTTHMTTMQALGLLGVVVKEKACYPHTGVMTITGASGVPVSTTFDAQTPTTGLVKVAFGTLPPITQSLPPYSSCPNANGMPDAGTPINRRD